MLTSGLTDLDSSVVSLQTGPFLNRLAFRCAVAVFFLGALGLAGGLTGHLAWSRPLASSIPMAMSTALLFLATGWVMIQAPSIRPGLWRRPLNGALAAVIAVVGLLNLLEYGLGLGNLADPLDWLAYLLQTALGLEFTPMSPATGAVFVVLGASLLMLVVHPDDHPRAARGRGIAGVLGGLTAVSGLTLLLGYFYGSPFLYESTVVPVAFPTSVSFLIAGAGIVCAAGPNALPLRPFLGNSIRSQLLRAFTPVMALFALVYPVLSKLLLIAEVNNALLTSIWAVFFAGIASALVIQVGRTLGSTMDRAVSLRAQAERSLRVSEERFREFIEGTDNVVTQVDGQGRFVYVNRVAAELFGRSPGECVGLLAFDMVFPEDREKTLRAFTGWLGQRVDRATFVNRQTAASGEPRTLLWNMHFHYDDAGNLTHVNSIAQDITERTRYEEMMIQTEKMISLGGLAAGMAHEINNPLSGILQSIQVIERRTSADAPASRDAAQKAGCSLEAVHEFLKSREIFSMLQNVREAGSRAGKIVANMLEFSRKAESKKTNVSLGDLLDKTVELCANDYGLKQKYDFRKILIERDYALDLPPVPCTATQIEQVILNILRNAAQAMAERQGEALQPAKIILRTGRENGCVRIEVADNGPGMDEAVRRRIFEPFFTTKEPGVGTGLGLSVSYFIITQHHGGTIRVESTPGKGSTFIITLPLEMASGPAVS